MELTPLLARRIARAIGLARVALGATALVAPGLLTRPWVGDRRGDGGLMALGRALGGRDIALGAGAVLAMRHDETVRGWVEGGAMADLTDAAATAVYFGALPRRGRWAVLVAAAGSAAAAGMVARQVDAGR